MAPSASMLFLSYHQLHHHHGPAAAAAEVDAAPREGGAGAGGFRFSFRNVFSAAVLTPRPEVAGGEGKKQRLRNAGGDQEETAAGAALGSRFEEAVELSCWSS